MSHSTRSSLKSLLLASRAFVGRSPLFFFGTALGGNLLSSLSPLESSMGSTSSMDCLVCEVARWDAYG